jgi:DNA-binding beta-propeller fold protein YncE
MAINVVTNKIYFTRQPGSPITVLDGATLSLTEVPAGTFPNALAVDQLRNKIYVADFAGGQVVIIDGLTNDTTSVTGLGNPFKVDVNPLTNEFYVMNNSAHFVSFFEANPATLPFSLLEQLGQ